MGRVRGGGGEETLHGPIFIQEPYDITYSMGSANAEILLNCTAKGYPLPYYRWKQNGTDIDLTMSYHYRLVGGSLAINNPHKNQDIGTYQCLATNSFGTILSRKAKLQFACLSYMWIFNNNTLDLQEDSRRFVSQATGNLYLAKVEPWDVGNYTCAVSSAQAQRRVWGPPTALTLRGDGVMGEYEPKIEVRFPETTYAAEGSSVRLECFALGNPVPSISWKRSDGNSLAKKIQHNRSRGVLEIPNVEQEDEGSYECIAGNTRGINVARGQLFVYAPPEWDKRIQNAFLSLYDSLFWECKARGKPSPSYSWLKNGQPLLSEERIQIENGTLLIPMLNLSDSGLYQCVAENKYDTIYANAELRVIVAAPDFSRNPVKKLSVIQVGGEVTISCKPSASPRAVVSWRKGSDVLRQNKRVVFLEDGSLRISNISKVDAGVYTCVATNQFGTARNSGNLIVKERTVITIPPSDTDATVGESIVLPCQVSHDPSLDVVFSWSFNGQRIDLSRGIHHFERIGRGSSGDLMIRNIQLHHSGKYMCTVQTSLDRQSAAADIIVRGPPGPPEDVKVEHVSSTTAGLSWKPGADNNSPVQIYSVQTRTPFSVGWQAVATAPEVINGRTHKATVVDLSPWVEYEFRVVASNSVGIGEPSRPSALLKTKAAVQSLSHLLRGGMAAGEVRKCSDHPLGKASRITESNLWPITALSRAGHSTGGVASAEGQTLPWPCGLTVADPGQVTLAFLPTWAHLASSLAAVTNTPRSFFCRATFRPLFPHLGALHEAVVTREQDPAFHLVEPHSTDPSPRIQPAQIPPSSRSTLPLKSAPTSRVTLSRSAVKTLNRLAPGLSLGEPAASTNIFPSPVPVVAPTNVSGGGGSRSELVITWEPVSEELQNGEGFGYIVMFRPLGSTTWTKAAVASVESSKYVYRNESITPLSPFEVKVGVYNNEGEGTLSSISIIYSGEDGNTSYS
ncbi:hypothetical protein DUI87_24581 [Hirundo rustica rustica]|uniref:Contactin-6 n=1 Tax=Hirundo rustica rustica TaxID=333673 RepID=A0A3M0JDI2_HIRRU|nr:hypothetical protein DUI87_24581 [Hirundo rustica rustica]